MDFYLGLIQIIGVHTLLGAGLGDLEIGIGIELRKEADRHRPLGAFGAVGNRRQGKAGKRRRTE